MNKRLIGTMSFRVTADQRKTIKRAARLAGKDLSDWVRLIVVTESEIQLRSQHYGKGEKTA